MQYFQRAVKFPEKRQFSAWLLVNHIQFTEAYIFKEGGGRVRGGGFQGQHFLLSRVKPFFSYFQVSPISAEWKDFKRCKIKNTYLKKSFFSSTFIYKSYFCSLKISILFVIRGDAKKKLGGNFQQRLLRVSGPVI